MVKEVVGETKASSSVSSSNSSYASSASQMTQSTAESHRKTVVEQPLMTTLHLVEGLALVTLCNTRSYPRKLAVHILKEVKNLTRQLSVPEGEPSLVDVIDKICPQLMMERCLPSLPQTERAAVLSANVIDLQWISERTNGVWTVGHTEDSTRASTLSLNATMSVAVSPDQFDPWAALLFGFMERQNVPHHCPSAVLQAWPICYHKVTTLFTVVDPT